MDKEMKVSIIIPAYNAEKDIARCIKSILCQTYCNFEVIIINDGSVDNTLEELSAFRDDRITIISTENKGVSNARNIGLNTATGEIIGFVDADDYISPAMLETVVSGFNTADVELVVCSFTGNDKKANGRTTFTKCEMLYETIDGNLFKGFIWNKFFYSDIIKKNQIRFNKDIHMCEDMLFCLEYIQHINKGLYIDKELYSYIVSDSSMTRNGFSIKRLSVLKAYSEILNLDEFKESNTLRELIINRRVRNCLAMWTSAKRDSNFEIRKLVELEIWPFLNGKNTFLSSKKYSLKEKVLYIAAKVVISVNVKIKCNSSSI